MLLGRNQERDVLREAYDSDEADFVVVYGRRRVGKTFLVRETFDNRFTFYHTGLHNVSTRHQLREFKSSLMLSGYKAATPKTWFEAFGQLSEMIRLSADAKKVIFIDEMPWMDAPHSNFVAALEHFWNGFASARSDVLLIVCGSATSWIVRNIFRNRGGLYNRVTKRIHLHPFSLYSCEQYAEARSLGMTRRQVLTAYMILGGVPYYWSMLKKGLSLDQNIDLLCFNQDGMLRHEFAEMFESLFNSPEPYVSVITALATRRIGMTRKELAQEAGLSNNGRLTQIIENLIQCDFVEKYYNFGNKENNSVVRLVDNYILFYFRFMRGDTSHDENYWTHNIDKPAINIWRGLAFEQVCMSHVKQIKQKLGIAGVATSVGTWHATSRDGNGAGAQIDLLIDRADGVINVCEIKYSKAEYTITSDYSEKLQWKCSRFAASTRTNKAIHLTMITTCGLERNRYANEVFAQVLAEDLFEP